MIMLQMHATTHPVPPELPWEDPSGEGNSQGIGYNVRSVCQCYTMHAQLGSHTWDTRTPRAQTACICRAVELGALQVGYSC